MLEQTLLPERGYPSTNLSKYDVFRLAPSDSELQLMWRFLSGVSFVAASCTGFLMIAILSSPKARRTPFNLYIVGLMVPDFVFMFCCGITCALNSSQHGYVSSAMCDWQSAYLVFGVGASCWMNGLVSLELYGLMRTAATMQPYFGKSARAVSLQCLAVYAWAGFVASWTLWDVLPHQAFYTRGLLCAPTEYSVVSTYFFWFAFIPAVAGIPATIAFYVAFQCWRQSLLSRNFRTSIAMMSTASVPSAALDSEVYRHRVHQTRSLALYFTRIFLCLLLMWAPAIFLVWVLSVHSHWLVWLGATWGHLQGLVSAMMSLSKEDVKEAALHLLRCQPTRSSAVMPKPVKRAHEDSSEREVTSSLGDMDEDLNVAPMPLCASALALESPPPS